VPRPLQSLAAGFTGTFAIDGPALPVTISLLRKLCDGVVVGFQGAGGGKGSRCRHCVQGTTSAMRPCVSASPWLSSMALGVAVACGGGPPGPDVAPRGEPSSAEPARAGASRCASSAAPELAPLPLAVGGFCVEAYGRVRAYGLGASLPLERACDQVLGPGCVVEGDHGLERVLAVRYVDARDGGATVDVIAARFVDSAGAYARFGDQLIGDRDPASLALEELPAAGVTVREGERVSTWLGRYVLSADYGDDGSDPEVRARAAAARLPEVARGLSSALPADPELPLAVQKLPAAHRVPFGTRLVLGDAIGVPGMGMGAIGYHRQGDKRWRSLAIVRPDADAAQDVLGTLAASPGARKLKNGTLEAVALTFRRLPTEPNVQWVVGQRRELLYGVGDEATALPESTSAEREAIVNLSLPDKLLELTRMHTE
jgi:uncharacterized protein DUF6599